MSQFWVKKRIKAKFIHMYNTNSVTVLLCMYQNKMYMNRCKILTLSK